MLGASHQAVPIRLNVFGRAANLGHDDGHVFGGHHFDRVPGADGQLVRRERWVGAKLTALRASASPEQLAEIDRLIAEQIDKVVSNGSPNDLRRWIEIGGTHPKTDDCRVALVGRLGGGDTLLEREQLLSELAESLDKDRHPTALAALAELYAESKQNELAAAMYQRLADEWGDTVVRTHDRR